MHQPQPAFDFGEQVRQYSALSDVVGGDAADGHFAVRVQVHLAADVLVAQEAGHPGDYVVRILHPPRIWHGLICRTHC